MPEPPVSPSQARPAAEQIAMVSENFPAGSVFNYQPGARRRLSGV